MEDNAYNNLMNKLKKEASYYTGREITEEEILKVGERYGIQKSNKSNGFYNSGINRNYTDFNSTCVDNYSDDCRTDRFLYLPDKTREN